MSRHHAHQIRQAEHGPDALCAVLIEQAHDIQRIVLNLRHVATRLSADPRVWCTGASLSNAALILSDVAADVATSRSKLRAPEESAPSTDGMLFGDDQADDPIGLQSVRDAQTNADVSAYNADAPRREREIRAAVAAAEAMATIAPVPDVAIAIAAVMSDTPIIPEIIPEIIPDPADNAEPEDDTESPREWTRRGLPEDLRSLMDDPAVNAASTPTDNEPLALGTPLSALGIEQALVAHLTLNGIHTVEELAQAIRDEPDLWTFHDKASLSWSVACRLNKLLVSRNTPGIDPAPHLRGEPSTPATPTTDKLVALATGAVASKAKATPDDETPQPTKRTRKPKTPKPEAAPGDKPERFDPITEAEAQVAEWLKMIAQSTSAKPETYVRLLGMSLMTLQNTAGERHSDTTGLNTYLISLRGYPCYAIASHDFRSASGLAHALHPYTTHEVMTKAGLTGLPDHVAILSAKTLGRLDRIAERVREEQPS